MKKKIAVMALSAVLGLSMFGGVAQAKAAQAASTQGCQHASLDLVDDAERIPVAYDPASGLFHNTLYQISYTCPYCNKLLYVYEWVYEDHTFYVRNEYGHWVCHYCGFEDDTNP